MDRPVGGFADMKKALCYYRKSIERDAAKSIAGQKEEVHNYAEENNIEIVAEYEEVAFSGTTEREQFELMLNEVTTREDIDYILVHRFDRISREPTDMGFIITLLKRAKVKTKIHSVTEDNDYDDDPTKIMMILMKTYGAAMERRAIVDRLQGARQRKKAKGGFIGGTPPQGYTAVMGTGRLIINEDEVPVVKEVFKLREQGLSMNKIATKLNDMGFTTRKGLKFYSQTVQRIIKHEKLYRGEYEDPGILEKEFPIKSHYTMEEAEELGIEMIKSDIPAHLMRTRIAPYKIYEELGILNEIKKPIFIKLIGAGTPNKSNLAFFEIDESHYIEDEEEAFKQGFWSEDAIRRFLDIELKERPKHGFVPVGYVMNKGFKTLYDVRSTEQFQSFLLRQTEGQSEE